MNPAFAPSAREPLPHALTAPLASSHRHPHITRPHRRVMRQRIRRLRMERRRILRWRVERPSVGYCSRSGGGAGYGDGSGGGALGEGGPDVGATECALEMGFNF